MYYVCIAGERERIVAGTERGDLLVVEGGDLRLALPFEGAPAIDAIQATPKAICASCTHNLLASPSTLAFLMDKWPPRRVSASCCLL